MEWAVLDIISGNVCLLESGFADPAAAAAYIAALPSGHKAFAVEVTVT